MSFINEKTEHDAQLDTVIKYLKTLFVVLRVLFVILGIAGGVVCGYFFRYNIGVIVGLVVGILLILISLWIIKIVQAFTMVKYYSYENLIKIRDKIDNLK